MFCFGVSMCYTPIQTDPIRFIVCLTNLTQKNYRGTTPAHRFECGIYGLLARDIDCVTPLLQTWSDYLWCKTRVHELMRIASCNCFFIGVIIYLLVY